MKNEHVSPPTGDWRLRLGRTKRLIGISETHLKCPPQIAEVTILIGSAPTWTGQPKAKTTLEIADFRGKIETYIEKSPMHISLLKARITPDLVDDMENLQIRITHDVTLQERGLVQGKDSLSQKINESDRIAYCRLTQTLDFNNAIFEKFCTDNNLIKSTEESNIDFSFNVFRVISRKFSGGMKPNQKRIASSLCKDDGFECNSSSTLFAAILRRNQIPTRILCCRNDFGSYPTPQLALCI